MKLSELKDKKIIIVGYGIEGQATMRFLKHHFPDKEIAVADAKDGPGYLKKMEGFDLAIKTPGVPRRNISIPYTTATNIFFANTQGKIIGITGSKGKSTTTKLIFEILSRADKDVKLVGNIGAPMLEELLTPESTNRLYVCELSSYQLEDLTLSPYISVFVSFFPDHLDYHGGIDAYWQAKANIIAHATREDFFVFNPRFPQIATLAETSPAKAVPYLDSLPFPVEIIPLLGEHNVDNVRAAVTVTKLLAVPDSISEMTVREFVPLPHRLEKVGTFKGVTFYDDAISTTPESTIAGIDALGTIGTIFLGGADRGYDFTQLGEKVIEKGIANVVLFPQSGTRIKLALESAALKLAQKMPKLCEASDMKKAVQFAYEHTPKETICLLSTASPSYSLWKNFEEKGGKFKTEVLTYR